MANRVAFTRAMGALTLLTTNGDDDIRSFGNNAPKEKNSRRPNSCIVRAIVDSIAAPDELHTGSLDRQQTYQRHVKDMYVIPSQTQESTRSFWETTPTMNPKELHLSWKDDVSTPTSAATNDQNDLLNMNIILKKEKLKNDQILNFK